MQLDSSVATSASTLVFDEAVTVTALTAAVLLTLTWLQDTPDPRIELRVDTPHLPACRVEIVQRVAAVPPHVGLLLQNPALARTGLSVESVALQVLQAATGKAGGAVEVVPINGRGSVIQCTFGQKPTVS